MLNWTKFQEDNYGVHNNYERKTISPELKLACDKLLQCVKLNKIPFKERPLISEHYENRITKYHAEFRSENLSTDQVREWINDPKYKRAITLPIREISYLDIPDAEKNQAISTIIADENVYQKAVMFRIILLEPGDLIILHYDPRTFYTPDGIWQQDHLGKYKDKRGFVFMHDRMPGQVSYLGNSEIDYKKYDMFKYDTDKLYHGAANFGYDDRIMICFSWAEPI